MSGEVWEQVYERLAELIAAASHDAGLRQHAAHGRARRAASRARRLGEEDVAAHHGSLAKERRLDAEQRLKRGELRGARRDRVARARHRHRRRRSRLPDRLAALDRDVPAARRPLRPQRRPACRRGGSSRCRATSWSSARRCSTRCAAASSTASRCPTQPLDVLAQQIVAEVACARMGRGRAVRRWSGAPSRTRSSTRDDFDAVVRMLAEGFAHAPRPPRARYLHRDAVNGVLRGRRGARLTAITSGGAIPDTADYDVVLEPDEHSSSAR